MVMVPLEQNYAFLRDCAFLSNAVYEEDENVLADEIAKKGFRFIALLTNGIGDKQGDAQALICTNELEQFIVWRGTEVTTHLSFSELFDDIRLDKICLWSGYGAAAGFWEPVTAIISQILRLLDPAKPIVIPGHSKGGSHAHVSRCFFPIEANVTVISFGAPACVTAGFGEEVYGPNLLGLLRVVAKKDFAPDWGKAVGWKHPCDKFLWLKEDGPIMFSGERPGLDDSLSNHSIENEYYHDLSVLADKI